jgi:23S rRNA (cytosine1962-C5)-methyltransferase
LDPFVIDTQVQISAAAVRRVRRGYLWVYAGEVESEPSDQAPAIVRVVDGASNIIGYAFYSRQSQIRLRFLSRDPEPPGPEFLRSRIANSVGRRGNLSVEGAACRLIFGEADLLPSIIVDRYGEYLALQTLSSGADALKPVLVDILRELLRPEGIFERNDVKARLLEGLDEVRGLLWGTVPEEVEIHEDAVRFLVDVRRGQKTGFFLDQSQNRLAAAKHASGRVLDCFTNTGAFALHFARRADSVLAVDISSESLLQARRNCELNGFRNVEFLEANVFDLLRELQSQGQYFDMICLDPPAFAKNRRAQASARSGYKEINLRALRLLRPEGILVTSSCSYHMSESDFFDVLCEAASDSRRFIQVIERRGQAADHPVLAGMPETQYLKCFLLRAL